MRQGGDHRLVISVELLQRSVRFESKDMILSWLNFTVRANKASFRVDHARNAGKIHPLLLSMPYGYFASVDNNPLRLVQGARSRVKLLSKELAERSSHMGLRGRRCVPIADASAFCLFISSDGNRFDWLSVRDSSTDLTSDGAQGMSSGNMQHKRLV